MPPDVRRRKRLHEFLERRCASPSHHGFGLRLLSRALEQFSGAVETTFEPDGLVCTMKAVLPESTPSIVQNDQPTSPPPPSTPAVFIN